MACASPLAPGPSPILKDALQRRNVLARAEGSGRAALVSLSLAALCLLEADQALLLSLVCPALSPFSALALYCLEMLLAAGLLAGGVGAAWAWLAPSYALAPLSLTARQFSLLRLPPSSPGFTRAPDPTPLNTSPTSPLPGPLVSSPALSSSLAGHSWCGSPSTVPVTPARATPATQFPPSPATPLTDPAQLASYLASYTEWEASTQSQSVLESPASPVVASPASRLDFSPDPRLSRPVYQLSSPDPPSLATTGSISSSGQQDQASARVLSHRLGIEASELITWNENLRVWLTQTLLAPLVKEVDSVNSALPRLGVGDCTVGGAAVDRLRKVSQLPQVRAGLPSLPALLPYLELSADQPYLLARLRELSSTGAMSKFRWNGGGPGWTDRLPSDSEVLMHFLATYLDSRLLSTTSTRLTIPTDRAATPFSGVHYFTQEKDLSEKARKDKSTLALVQLERSPPHFVLQVGQERLDVGEGRNNLLHSLLLFLHTVKQDRAGLLARVNFGLSGLNILWVLD